MAFTFYAYKRLLAKMRSDPLKKADVSEVYPGSNVTSDEDIKKAIFNSARSFYHPGGSVSLGKALDTSFKLRGLEGIRVIDSSAVPGLPTCHVQPSIYALAEFAAKMLKMEKK